MSNPYKNMSNHFSLSLHYFYLNIYAGKKYLPRENMSNPYKKYE